jgi:hypothetical protein
MVAPEELAYGVAFKRHLSADAGFTVKLQIPFIPFKKGEL